MFSTGGRTIPLNAALRRSAKQQRVLTPLAQQGITWQQLKMAYDEEFERGHSAMLDFHLSFFTPEPLSLIMSISVRHQMIQAVSCAALLSSPMIIPTGKL